MYSINKNQFVTNVNYFIILINTVYVWFINGKICLSDTSVSNEDDMAERSNACD